MLCCFLLPNTIITVNKYSLYKHVYTACKASFARWRTANRYGEAYHTAQWDTRARMIVCQEVSVAASPNAGPFVDRGRRKTNEERTQGADHIYTPEHAGSPTREQRAAEHFVPLGSPRSSLALRIFSPGHYNSLSSFADHFSCWPHSFSLAPQTKFVPLDSSLFRVLFL